MRWGRWRGDGQHQVVVTLVHQLDICAQRFPEGGQAGDRGQVRLVPARLGGEDGPAVGEERGVTGVGTQLSVPAMGWPGMAKHAWRQAGEGLGHDGLHRSDIGDDGSRLERSRDLGGDLADGQRGGGQHHQVGVAHRLGRVRSDGVGEAQGAHPLQHRGADVGDRDLVDDVLGPDGADHRRADQAAADHGHACEQGLAHALFRKSARASTTARLCSSRPMVRRR